MKTSSIFRYFTYFPLFITLFLLSCSDENKDDGPRTVNLGGLAQKGPFINGGSITLYDLQTDLTPTGKSFNVQIVDNSGSFELGNVQVSSRYVKMRADGFYYNEVSGQQSAAQITLYGLADIENKSTVNVNLMTHLENSRVEKLMEGGMSFSDAKAQAQREILAVFNIVKSDMESSEFMDISKEGEDNAILLAISSILQGYRTESELTELMSNIINEMRDDGTMDDQQLGSSLINHAIVLDTVSITNNLLARYEELGSAASIPHFGKYISNFIENTEFVVTKLPIEYPSEGLYGKNILIPGDTLYERLEGVDFSLAANIGRGARLKIKISSIGSLDDTLNDSTEYRPFWYYVFGSQQNWKITNFDMDTYTQYFTSIDPDASCDLSVEFDKGRFLIEYFEMDAVLPNRSKIIKVY